MYGSFHSISAQQIFGQGQQYADNESQQDDNTDIYAEYLSLTTPSLPAGTYRIGWTVRYSASTASTNGEVRVQVNISTTVEAEVVEISSAGERKTFARFESYVHAGGTMQVDIDMRRSAGPGTFSVFESHLELWRAS